MTYRNLLQRVFFAALLAGSSYDSYAQSGSCAGYRIMSETIASAGGVSTGGSYIAVDTAGQPAVGSISFGSSYVISAGDADPPKDPLPIWATYLAWKQAFFTPAQQNDPNSSAPAADPDRDADPNLLEYATGSDPTSASSAARPFIVTDPTRLTHLHPPHRGQRCHLHH